MTDPLVTMTCKVKKNKHTKLATIVQSNLFSLLLKNWNDLAFTVAAVGKDTQGIGAGPVDTVDTAGTAGAWRHLQGMPAVHKGCRRWAWAQLGRACSPGTVGMPGRPPGAGAFPEDHAVGRAVPRHPRHPLSQCSSLVEGAAVAASC